MFRFQNNAYVARIPYGLENHVDVHVGSRRFHEKYELETVIVSFNGVAVGRETFYHVENRISKMYHEWNAVLCPKLTEHLLRIVDDLLEKLENDAHKKRKAEWVKENPSAFQRILKKSRR